MTPSVLIVGSGPTGLTLACDLARWGVAVRVIEKSPRFPRGSRAKGPNARSLEVLEDLGVVREVLAGGSAPPVMRTYRGGQHVADSDPGQDLRPTPNAPYERSWLIPQWRLERILRDRLADHGHAVELGAELVALTQRETTVTATLADGRRIEADYLVGCDGGHSTVRKLLGVPFAGKTTPEQAMVCGDVTVDGPDRSRWHQWFGEDGGVLLCPIPGTRSDWWFQAAPERDAEGSPVAPSRDSFQRLFERYSGLADVHIDRATLLSTYRVNARVVNRFQVGRVLLAGDAAHVHPIAGGLGMNTGIQDAANLGWKLAMVLRRQAGAALLETYQEERRPIAAWTLGFTADRLSDTLDAIGTATGGLETAITPETSTLGLGYRWSSLSRHTDGAERAVRAGDRAPDAPCRLATTGEPHRLFQTFAGPHFTLLGFGPSATAALREVAAAHGGLVRTCPIAAGAEGLLDDRRHARIGYDVSGDALALVRPDGYLALFAPADESATVRDYLDRLGQRTA